MWNQIQIEVTCTTDSSHATRMSNRKLTHKIFIPKFYKSQNVQYIKQLAIDTNNDYLFAEETFDFVGTLEYAFSILIHT